MLQTLHVFAWSMKLGPPLGPTQAETPPRLVPPPLFRLLPATAIAIQANPLPAKAVQQGAVAKEWGHAHVRPRRRGRQERPRGDGAGRGMESRVEYFIPYRF